MPEQKYAAIILIAKHHANWGNVASKLFLASLLKNHEYQPKQIGRGMNSLYNIFEIQFFL
jgi:hypothetical protein